MPRSSRSRRIRLSTPIRTETSSIDVGSSARITSGFHGQRAGDGDALTLAAGELERRGSRACPRAGRPSPSAPRSSPRGARAWLAVQPGGALEEVSTRWTGLSEPNGSWKTICTLLRYSRDARRGSLRRTSTPSTRICPAVGCSSRAMQRAIVLLPLPDSPTSAMISPRSSRRSTALSGTDACAGEEAADLEVLGQSAQADHRGWVIAGLPGHSGPTDRLGCSCSSCMVGDVHWSSAERSSGQSDVEPQLSAIRTPSPRPVSRWRGP